MEILWKELTEVSFDPAFSWFYDINYISSPLSVGEHHFVTLFIIEVFGLEIGPFDATVEVFAIIFPLKLLV